MAQMRAALDKLEALQAEYERLAREHRDLADEYVTLKSNYLTVAKENEVLVRINFNQYFKSYFYCLKISISSCLEILEIFFILFVFNIFIRHRKTKNLARSLLILLMLRRPLFGNLRIIEWPDSTFLSLIVLLLKLRLKESKP